MNRIIADFNTVLSQKKFGLDADTIAAISNGAAVIHEFNKNGVFGEEGISKIGDLVDVLDNGVKFGLDSVYFWSLVDRVAHVIDQQPENWGDQAERVVQLLNIIGTEKAKDLADGIDRARRQIVADTAGLIGEFGEQARCTIDFTGQRVLTSRSLKLAASLWPACCPSPLTITNETNLFLQEFQPFALFPLFPLNWYGETANSNRVLDRKVVLVSGFNFSVDQMPSVSLRSDDGKTQYSVPLLAHPTVAHQLTVNLTGKQYEDIVNPVGLVFEWPDNALPNSRFYKVVKVEFAPVAIAGFSAAITSGDAPLQVDFHNRSTGEPTIFRWNFGDTTPVSTAQNPTHTYTKPGVYAVTLTVSNRFSNPDTLAITNFITVTVPPGAGNPILA